ncbi:MAG TPA: aldehyde dehydrogenase family protein, partial [Myxococcota bacterium]|nr:aldehyde dehydrogenase family protein [Myxococcota bacterium]
MARLGPHHIHCIDPRTGVEAGDIACTPLADIPALATRARTAQRSWAATSLAQRKKVVEAWKNAILARAADVAALLVAEIGKPEAEAWSSEILTAGELFDGWLANIDDLLAPQPVDLNPVNYPGKEVVVSAQARGLIGMIMPWNYPFHLPLRTMVPALLAGNAVIWKPSEHAARVGALLGEIAASVLPADLLVTVQGAGEQGVA